VDEGDQAWSFSAGLVLVFLLSSVWAINRLAEFYVH
jgi:hypothetical protein